MSKSKPITIFVLCAMASLPGCTHTFGLTLEGKAAPRARINASHWVQPRDHEAPVQRPGRTAVAGPDGRYTVESVTVLDFDGPPPHVTLEVTGVGPDPLCVIVPTEGLWVARDRVHVSLPELRPLAPGEITYELPVAGLTEPIKVLRKDPSAAHCAAPGG